MVDNVKFNQIRIDYKWQSIENVKQKTENREMGRTHTCSQMEISTRREREAHTNTQTHAEREKKETKDGEGAKMRSQSK